MSQSSRLCCHDCGQILAQRQTGMLILRVPAIVVRGGRIRVECSGCKRLIWLALPVAKEAA